MNQQTTEQNQFKIGDYVTLCPTEFDDCKYDGVWRIQFMKGNICFVTTMDEYIEIDPLNPPSTLKVLPEHVELEELYPASQIEIDNNTRNN